MKNLIVASNPGVFYGWPANNGAWTWEDGREILVGFSYGKFVEQEGHNTFVRCCQYQRGQKSNQST